MARPSKYQTHVAPRLIEIQDWVRNGATDEEVAKRLGISRSTLCEYKNGFSEFSDTIKKGKDFVDAEVENALLERAIGGKVCLRRPFKVKRTIFNNGRKVEEKEEIVYAEYEEYVIPDTTAQIFWLKNRRPERWRDKPIQEVGEGKDEGFTMTIEDCSDEENNPT